MKAAIYLLGVLIINYRVFIAYWNLKKSEFFNTEQLDAMQNAKLQSLAKSARELSPHYCEMLGQIRVEDINLDTLKKIPILTKSKLREINDDLSIDHKHKHIKSETSGSSGQAFVFYRDKWWDAYHRAAIYRGMRQFGVSPWAYNIYIWGFLFSPRQKFKTKILDWLQNRSRIFRFEKINKKIHQDLARSKYISGYSSVINNLAQKAISQSLRFDNIVVAKGTSEKIFPSYKDNVMKAFGVRLISEYGAAECGIIAFECTAGNMHVQRENVILEEIDGRAIVTNLNSYSLPIIRFDLGDYIKLSKVACPCGRHEQVVEDILGRVGKEIHGKSQRYPSLTLYYVFKDLALEDDLQLSYGAEQHISGSLDVLIYDNPSIDDDVLQIIRSKFTRYFNHDLIVNIRIKELSARKEKLTDFRSFL